MKISIDERKQNILKVIVRNHILTGKPVGSGTVAEIAGINVSTATIRNEMSALEDLGMLMQPHRSAGRVPTDTAYRYYVDVLMVQKKPAAREEKAVAKLFDNRGRDIKDIEVLMHSASVLLSELTHTAAIVFAPFTPADTVRHIDLIPLGLSQVMVIVITSQGQVGRRLLSLYAEVDESTVAEVGQWLDKALHGVDVDAVDSRRIIEKASFPTNETELLEYALIAICDYLGSIDDRVFIGGTANIVRKMASAGSEWAQLLFEAMDNQFLILDMLRELISEKQLIVRIGKENIVTELHRCAFIGTSYSIGSGILGSLGVVGPTSIDYERTIGMVELMADNLGRSFQLSVD